MHNVHIEFKSLNKAIYLHAYGICEAEVSIKIVKGDSQ